MKIGYFAPMSPDPSGVSDFCEELLPELHKYMDIDIFARERPTNPEILHMFQYYPFSEINIKKIRDQYSLLIYQIGNNRKYHKGVIEAFLQYPGILEIHDLSLHHYLAEDTFLQHDLEGYVNIMKYCHGDMGEITAKRFLNGEIRAPWETDSFKYTVNKHLIDKAQAVIVHSDMAKQFVKGINGRVPVISIPLHASDIILDYESFRKECRKKLKINVKLVMGSFGYATTAKRIPAILEALAEYKKINSDFLYYIVGKVENMNIEQFLCKYNLMDNVVVTGFVNIEDFKMYMGACDICFNLRYPTQGESSASLHRMLGMGKPVLATNIGSFAEYPDDIVLKIRHDNHEVEDIIFSLKKLTESNAELNSRSQKAIEYAKKYCDLHINAKKYCDFFTHILSNDYEDTYLDTLLDTLYELKLTEKNFIENLSSNMIH